ncbi:MAG: HAD family hydrolase [Acutalibacteraceae bacterium]
MKYKVLIFDLDGTILNTLDDLTDSFNHVLTCANMPARTTDEVMGFVGNGIHKLIERGVPNGTSPQDIEKVYTEFKKYYAVHCADKTKPYDGIPELLEELKNNGIKLAVVSNKADFAVQSLCQQYFGGLFDCVIGERSGVRRKPAPDTVNEVISTLKAERSDVVYIGDSDVDIQTAKNAGLDCISVSWGFRNTEFLKKNGAKTIVNAPNDILNIVLCD